jgi:hypothetical protein
VSVDEEVNEEDEESEYADDEEDVDEINHVTLSKETVHTHSPRRRSHRSPLWSHVRSITNHDVSEHGLKVDCTHVCVYPLSDGEGGIKRYYNKPLKLFLSKKGKETSWNTSTELGRFQKNHEDSGSAWQECPLMMSLASVTRRQLRWLSGMLGLSVFLRKTAFKLILIYPKPGNGRGLGEVYDRGSTCCDLSVFSRRGQDS